MIYFFVTLDDFNIFKVEMIAMRTLLIRSCPGLDRFIPIIAAQLRPEAGDPDYGDDAANTPGHHRERRPEQLHHRA